MKATGIVRRIDDLGRVVIPKEIRRTLRIREGDPLEIFTDREGGVILKKYSPIGELTDFSKEYAESLQQSIGHIVLIADKDAFISVSGATKKDYFERKPNASYLFFACMIFLFRVFLNWYANELQLVTLMDVIWTLMLTAGFVTGDRVRRKNKAMKDKIENELKKK